MFHSAPFHNTGLLWFIPALKMRENYRFFSILSHLWMKTFLFERFFTSLSPLLYLNDPFSTPTKSTKWKFSKKNFSLNYKIWNKKEIFFLPKPEQIKTREIQKKNVFSYLINFKFSWLIGKFTLEKWTFFPWRFFFSSSLVFLFFL